MIHNLLSPTEWYKVTYPIKDYSLSYDSNGDPDNWTDAEILSYAEYYKNIKECKYFVQSKNSSSATICDNCGKEKFDH